jgi:hypothetical protein
METTVVNIRDLPSGWESDPQYAYIGRAGKGLPGTFGNDHPVYTDRYPYDCRKCGVPHQRGEAVQAYANEFKARITTDNEFLKLILTVRGKKLVCFCSPQSCHGDVIATFLNNLPKEA